VEYIRANQGHSIRLVRSEDALQPVTSAEQVPVCVHGTQLALWEKILASGGLNRMGKSPRHRCATATVPGEK
jgi:2'-phosphotransferase